MNIVTDKRFLIGLAVGYFGLPFVMKNARGLVDRLKPATAAPTSA